MVEGVEGDEGVSQVLSLPMLSVSLCLRGCARGCTRSKQLLRRVVVKRRDKREETGFMCGYHTIS
jgi:hypothetical protein